MDGYPGEILTDLDSIAINLLIEVKKKDPHASPFKILVEFTVDVDNMIAFCGSKKLFRFLLEKTQFNDRSRPSRGSRKNAGVEFKLSVRPIKNKFAEGECETGMRWGVKFNGQEEGLEPNGNYELKLPCLLQVLSGLF